MKLVLSSMILILALSMIATSSSSSIRSITKESLSFRSHSIFRMTPTSTGTNKTNLEIVQAKNEKIIMVLQTRNNLITIYSGGEAPFYSVATDTGISLVDHLTPLELKARFPELYEVVTGWAGDAAEMDLVPNR